MRRAVTKREAANPFVPVVVGEVSSVEADGMCVGERQRVACLNRTVRRGRRDAKREWSLRQRGIDRVDVLGEAVLYHEVRGEPPWNRRPATVHVDLPFLVRWLVCGEHVAGVQRIVFE